MSANRTPSPTSAAAMLVVGAALGAALTIAFSSTVRERIFGSSFESLDPSEVLNRVARALQNTRDRVVEAVDTEFAEREG